jgi:hypothetical protein
MPCRDHSHITGGPFKFGPIIHSHLHPSR